MGFVGLARSRLRAPRRRPRGRPRRLRRPARASRGGLVAGSDQRIEGCPSKSRIVHVAVSTPDRLHYTESDEANALIAHEPLALLIGFALDQQVSVQMAFTGPLKIKQRLGTLEAGELASIDPDRLGAAFRERPAVHRFPGS